MKIDIDLINKIAFEAGKEILEVYNKEDFQVEIKSDKSPLTIADKISHSIIKEFLTKHYPDIPVLSEEGKETPFEERRNWKLFWLVDPLDGTKEFIKRNGEFTVNIALIKKNAPILGVIYIPVKSLLYYGSQGEGAFKINADGNKEKIRVKPQSNELIAVKSKSHSSESEDKFLSRFTIKNTISAGSSLKFCMVAEGKADIYYRGGPTWEWDTAAGHAIVEAAGGYCKEADGEFLYNKPVLLNKAFVVSNVIFKEN
jgi:3'(2'), 5'-bisphosphate nucleotidase